MTHDKTSIQRLLQQSDLACHRALEALYKLQTADEQSALTTKHTNGVGFTSFDAPFLSDIARKTRIYGAMTRNQLAHVRPKLMKYWRQLVDIANGHTPQPLPVRDVYATPSLAKSVATMATVSSECLCENYDGEMLCPACQRKQDLFFKGEFAKREAEMEEAACRAGMDAEFDTTGRLSPGSW